MGYHAMPLDPTVPAGQRVVRGACPHDCPDTCALLTTVENGRAIAIRGAPMMVIDGHYHERLTPAKMDELFDGLK